MVYLTCHTSQRKSQYQFDQGTVLHKTFTDVTVVVTPIIAISRGVSSQRHVTGNGAQPLYLSQGFTLHEDVLIRVITKWSYKSSERSINSAVDTSSKVLPTSKSAKTSVNDLGKHKAVVMLPGSS